MSFLIDFMNKIFLLSSSNSKISVFSIFSIISSLLSSKSGKFKMMLFLSPLGEKHGEQRFSSKSKFKENFDFLSIVDFVL